MNLKKIIKIITPVVLAVGIFLAELFSPGIYAAMTFLENIPLEYAVDEITLGYENYDDYKKEVDSGNITEFCKEADIANKDDFAICYLHISVTNPNDNYINFVKCKSVDSISVNNHNFQFIAESKVYLGDELHMILGKDATVIERIVLVAMTKDDCKELIENQDSANIEMTICGRNADRFAANL